MTCPKCNTGLMIRDMEYQQEFYCINCGMRLPQPQFAPLPIVVKKMGRPRKAFTDLTASERKQKLAHREYMRVYMRTYRRTQTRNRVICPDH